MSEPFISIHNLTFTYGSAAGTPVLDDVSLTLDRGASAAVVGPSGSGKSTLLAIIGAMRHVAPGHVHVDSHDLGRFTERQAALYRRRIGFVFQDFRLIPSLTVEENVLAPLLPEGRAIVKAHRTQARQLLEELGLGSKLRSLPAQLSGGQAQRVAIARALLRDPKLILSDEPTGNLDQATGHEVISLLTETSQRIGATLLVITHDAAIAGHLEQTIELLDGRLASCPAQGAL